MYQQSSVFGGGCCRQEGGLSQTLTGVSASWGTLLAALLYLLRPRKSSMSRWVGQWTGMLWCSDLQCAGRCCVCRPS